MGDLTWKDVAKYLGLLLLVVKVVAWVVRPADKEFNRK